MRKMDITPHNSISRDNISFGFEQHIPAEVAEVLHVRYHIVLPIFIIVAYFTNGFCILVAVRPNLKAYSFNIYVLMMSITDLLTFSARLPFIFDQEYCVYESYAFSLFIRHFGIILVNCFRTFSTYILVCMAYDRFIAVWF
ncbi:unnamed protein product, partial [Meganyctiphanes norvegica]